MTAGPDFTGLGFVGGAAEQEASESRAVKRKEGPEVAEAREGRGSQNRDCHQCQTDKESRQSPEPCCDDQKNTVDPQSISKFDTGEGQIRQHSDGGIEENFGRGPVKADSNVANQQSPYDRQCTGDTAGTKCGRVFEEV